MPTDDSQANLEAATIPRPFQTLPTDPWPDVMTEAEALRYLRLDLIDVKDPAGALTYYRRRGVLRATQIGKCIRYRRVELERFLDVITRQNPR